VGALGGAIYKGLLGLCFRKGRRKAFFSEEKKQQTFVCFGVVLRVAGLAIGG
jgi:hypothetical protein